MTYNPDHRRRNTGQGIAVLLALVATVSAACREQYPEPIIADRYTIYGALLQQAPLGPWRPQGPFVIEAETTFLDYLYHPNNVAYLKGHFSHIDPAIVDSLLSGNVIPVQHDQTQFPIAVILIKPDDVRQLIRSSPTWEEFERRFPGSRIAVAVSNVAFNGEGTISLVYWRYVCGVLCGGGVLIGA